MPSTFITGLFLLATLAGCTFTTTKPKEPVFKKDREILSEELNALIRAERYNVSGKEKRTNGKKESELEIRIYNPVSTPSKDQIYKWGEPVAIIIKNALSDSQYYDKYTVFFENVTKTDYGTRSDYISQTYRSDELKKDFHHVIIDDKIDTQTGWASGKKHFTKGDSIIYASYKFLSSPPSPAIYFSLGNVTDSTINPLLIDTVRNKLTCGHLYYKISVQKLYVQKTESHNFRVEFVSNDSIITTGYFQLQ